ncbi:glycosyltransferase [Paenibacillus sp. NPDC058071]|uniref:glycosyltransferase n=1 Tax=Paenibacillus sp. NPDC058071 TaxID=3346326 RepID=UPI0036DC8023
MTSIGVFWGYSFTLSFDQEGIGRYFFRLIEGMLAKKAYVIKVAVQPCNLAEMERVLEPLKKSYPDSLQILLFSDVPDLNRRAGVDLWIVPYVSLPNALQLDKPYLLCLHDLIYKHENMSLIYRTTSPEQCNYLDQLAPLMCERAAAVIFNSNFILQHDGLKEMKLPLWKTALIRTSAPVEEFELFGLMGEAKLRQKYNLGTPYLLFPSAVRYHKNHDRLVVAFLQFLQSPLGQRSNLQLVLTDHLHSHPMGVQIEKAMIACNSPTLVQRIRFIGRIDSTDLPSLYKYAKGTIVPTLFEGNLPFPLLESLAMNTPLAISRIPVTLELVRNVNSFIHFDPYSIAEMSDAIARLSLAGPGLVEREKQEMSEVMKRRWSDVANEYGNVIYNVLRAAR